VGCKASAPKEERPRLDLDSGLRHKLECQKLRKGVEDNVVQDSFEIESIYSVFYSSKANSCMLAKYTLFPHKDKKDSESLEIDDLLDQRQVWSQYLAESETYPEVEGMLDKQIDQLK
jgi:hypothetical protein